MSADDDLGVLLSLPARRAFVVWFFVGTAVAGVLQWSQSRAMGGTPEGLLFAGTWQEVHALVVEELPRTPVFEGYGHDGQIFYAVGLDLRGETVPNILLSAPYRYRRILFPALASAFGHLDGQALLWGMIALASLSAGLAAGAVAVIAHGAAVSGRDRLVALVPLAVILNPSVWLSARLLTADNLALAFSCLGLLLYLRRRDGWAIVTLAAAVLAKEPSLALVAGLFGHAWLSGERTRATRLLFGSLAPMLVWWSYVAVRIGNPLDSGGNVVVPFAGIIKSIPAWPSQSPRDWFYLSTVLIAGVLGTWVVTRSRSLWAFLIAPQLLVAVASSHLVWHAGNNASRAFGVLLVLSVCGLLVGLRGHDENLHMEVPQGFERASPRRNHRLCDSLEGDP